jgi:hypothetical protein
MIPLALPLSSCVHAWLFRWAIMQCWLQKEKLNKQDYYQLNSFFHPIGPISIDYLLFGPILTNDLLPYGM